MTYHQFIDEVQSYMSDHISAGSKISIQPITKNNNIHLDGLTIIEADSNLSPTIYLNYYYEELEQGTPLDTLKQNILTTYLQNKPRKKIDVSFYTDYSNIQDKILYKIINYEKNKELLEDVPHYTYLDLAIVFYCLVSTTPTGSATILIHNKHLDFWNITKDTLYGQALVNTPKVLCGKIENLGTLMAQLLTPLEYSEVMQEESSTCPMYVLTNELKLYGAGCIIYPHLLKDFANKIGDDLYIIPSSIHEVLLVPMSWGMTARELTTMVKDVNTTQVIDEEILSDRIYYYSRQSDRISL